MKKYLMGFSAIALALVFSAFSMRPAISGITDDIRWGKTDASGTLVSPAVIYTGTEADARTHFSCPTDGPDYCAKQVNNLNQPVSGGLFIKRSN